MTENKEIQKAEQKEVTRKNDYYLPPADIWEHEDGIEIELDMPGVSKENVDLKVERDSLVVHGTVSAPGYDRELYNESRIGDFHREFRVSDDIDTEKIEAEMNNGVLHIHLSKAESVKPRKIEIKAGG